MTGVRREAGGGNVSGMVSSDIMVDLGVKQIVSGGKHTLVLTMTGSVFNLESTPEGDYIPTVKRACPGVLFFWGGGGAK